MTTDSKSRDAEQGDAPTTREIFAEGRLNRERWQREWQEIRQRYPSHWITIFDGGRSVAGFDNVRAHFDHLNGLQGLTRSGAFTWPPPKPAGTRTVPSARRLPHS